MNKKRSLLKRIRCWRLSFLKMKSLGPYMAPMLRGPSDLMVSPSCSTRNSVQLLKMTLWL
jgi:hypothetical protein